LHPGIIAAGRLLGVYIFVWGREENGGEEMVGDESGQFPFNNFEKNWIILEEKVHKGKIFCC